MKIQPDFTILNGFAYLWVDRIQFSGFSSLKNKIRGKYPWDWSRLYLIFLIILFLSFSYGFYLAFSFGEDLKILTILLIWCLWVLYRIVLRWRFTWVQEIEYQTIERIEYYKPFQLFVKKINNLEDEDPIQFKMRPGYLRASFIIYYKTHSKFIWKRRIRLRGWGSKAERNLRQVMHLLNQGHSLQNRAFIP